LGLFFSPFRWLFLIFGIIVLAVIGITIVSTIFFGFALGHSLFFAPRFFPFFGFPFLGFGFLIFGLLIFGFFRFLFYPYRRRGFYGNRWYGYDSAMDSLRQRYARGEITRDQFEQMAGDLEKHR